VVLRITSVILYRGARGQALRALLGDIYGGPEESGQHVDGSERVK